MSRTANIWTGAIIGFLAGLLTTTLLLLFVPRLRPIIGLDNSALDTTPSTNTTPATTNDSISVDTAPDQPTESNTRANYLLENENIALFEPAPETSVSNPFTVKGAARVFENVVSIRLRDGDESVLAETFATAQSADIGLFGNFEVNLSYPQPRFSMGTLEVYQESARDGSEQDKISIPVEFTN